MCEKTIGQWSARLNAVLRAGLYACAFVLAGCSDDTPSEAKVQLDLQEYVQTKLGNDLVAVKVLEIVDKESPSEDRLVYKLQIRWESDEQKIAAFIAKQEQNSDMWGGYPNLRAVEFATRINGREEPAEVLFRKSGETWTFTELSTLPLSL